MNGVSLLRFREKLPNGSLGSFGRIGRADGFAESENRVRLLEYHWHAWPRCHELHERAIERPLLVHLVECTRLRLRHMKHASRHHLEAGVLEVRDYLPCLARPE